MYAIEPGHWSGETRTAHAAVAPMLAYVYQLRAALKGHVAIPAALPELNVPAELDRHNKPVPEMEIID